MVELNSKKHLQARPGGPTRGSARREMDSRLDSRSRDRRRDKGRVQAAGADAHGRRPADPRPVDGLRGGTVPAVDPSVARPDLAVIVECIRALAARAPELVVTIALREPAARRPMGTGSVVRKVSRGYVTYKPRLIVDGIVRWGAGVGVRAGLTEDEARSRAEQNLSTLLADEADGRAGRIDRRPARRPRPTRRSPP